MGLHDDPTNLDWIRIRPEMQKAKHDQKIKCTDTAWYSIGEYLLEGLSFDEQMSERQRSGWLSQTLRDLEIPPECLKSIECSLTDTLQAASGSTNHGLPDTTVRILLFCMKKKTAGEHPSEDQMNGGWGYYVIERGTNIPEGVCQACNREVELYLYKEGDPS